METEEEKRDMFTFSGGRCSVNLKSLQFWLALIIAIGAVTGMAVAVSDRVTHDVFVRELARSPFVDLTNPANGTEESMPAVAKLINRSLKFHETQAQLQYNRDLSLIQQNMALVEQRLDIMDRRIERIERMLETLVNHG